MGGNPLGQTDPRGLDNPGMGPYSPEDAPPDAFLCSGVLDTYPHMWLCANGSCSGYYGDIYGSSAALNIVAQVTLGTTGSWRKNPYKPNLCRKVSVPQSCDRQKFNKCISDATGDGAKGYYHAALSNCGVKSIEVIKMCSWNACSGAGQ